MTKLKYDGVIEAVHYTPEGQVKWVRAYERRGVVFSDHVLISRQELVDRLKGGKRFLTGQRKQYFASMFDVSQPVRLVPHNGHEILVTGDVDTGQDHLEGVPII